MTDANLAAWVAALRSGKYKQAHLALQNDTGFCCLGVACDLYSQAVDGHWESNGVFTVNGERGYVDLPTKVRDWLGIDAVEQERYIGMNDEDRAPFEQIADAIEAKHQLR